MKILYVAENLYFESGGPTKVVCELAENLARKGVEITLFATARPGKKNGARCPAGARTMIFEQDFLAAFWPGHSAGFARAIREEITRFDAVHIHEIWHYPHYAAALAARKARVPYVVTPHGAVDSWCLRRGVFKKKIFFQTAEKNIFLGAAAVQALTLAEENSIKKLAPASHVVKIPNGIRGEDFLEIPKREEFERQYPMVRGKKMVLYLGRINQKKGLDILAEAFAVIAGKRDDACLVIAGPDNDGYEKTVRRILEQKKVLDKALFTGILSGTHKMAALARADVFVLPSYSEGFSMAILEAMACGVPAIFTKQCNFPEVEAALAGLIIDCDRAQLVFALERLLDNDGLRAAIGLNAKRLVFEKFTLDAVADQMAALYRSIV